MTVEQDARQAAAEYLGRFIPSHEVILNTIRDIIQTARDRETAATPVAVYVCSREPYRDNTAPVAVAVSLEDAMLLMGYPDPADWRLGDPIGETAELSWYTTREDPLPTIRRFPVVKP